ncbi:MAG: monooxygenase [Hyphomicrobiaceae bacterium]
MITEIITFPIPDEMSRDDVVANYRRSAATWRANPDLIRKNYIFDPVTRRAGGVYTWRTMEAALRARGPEWMERVRRTYRAEPSVAYFETPLVADNALGETIDMEEVATASS